MDRMHAALTIAAALVCAVAGTSIARADDEAMSRFHHRSGSHGVDRRGDADQVDGLARATDVLFGPAAVLLTVGVVLYFVTDDSDEERSQGMVSRSGR